MRKLMDTRRGALCAPVTNIKIGRTQFVPTSLYDKLPFSRQISVGTDVPGGPYT